MEILVLGCGVMGLSCATRLCEMGHRVTIWARELPPHTTSDVAAALWLPYEAYPVEKVERWGRRSFEVFAELAKDPASGVIPIEGMELFRAPRPEPAWRKTVRDFRRLETREVPAGYAAGFRFGSYLADMSVYLPSYLLGRFRALGGRVEVRRLQRIEDAAGAPVIVNCTGLGARELVGDAQLYPLRGQVVRVERPAHFEFRIDDDHPEGFAYVIPRLHDCVLGGTAERDAWSLEPDPSTAKAIRARCSALVPDLAHRAELGHAVGLRPARSSVRLEAEQRSSTRLIHCYGHGGAGITLSWGCAEEVLSLLPRESHSLRRCEAPKGPKQSSGS